MNRVQERFYQLGAEITRTEESLQFNQQRIEQLNEELSQTQHRSLRAEQVESDDQQIQTMQAQVAELQPEQQFWRQPTSRSKMRWQKQRLKTKTGSIDGMRLIRHLLPTSKRRRFRRQKLSISIN